MSSTATIPAKKVRNSNLELYRIIVMLLIVIHHYVVNSGLMPMMEADPLNAKSLFLYIWGMWGKTGINCFVLITGYFMCQSEITLWKFLKLFLEMLFYSFTINLCFMAFGYGDISLVSFLWRLFPVHSITDGFASCYLVFFLFIPFLNILLRNINKRQHQLLLILLLGVYSLLYFLPYIKVSYNYVTWFCVLYVIGSYLRFYPIQDTNHRFWLKGLLVTVVLSMLSVIFMVWLNATWLSAKGLHYSVYYFVADSNAPLAILVSVCAFMYFKDLKIRQSKFINIVGGGTFGVLLIHANSDTMRQWLWKDVCDNAGHYSSSAIYLHAILVPVSVFIVCSIIEYIRMRTVETPLLNFTYNTIRKYFPNAK